jgi:hypothetical protein
MPDEPHSIDVDDRPMKQYELCAEQIAERQRAKGREVITREVAR